MTVTSRRLSKLRLRPLQIRRSSAGNKAALTIRQVPVGERGCSRVHCSAMSEKARGTFAFSGFHGSARKFILRTSPRVTSRLHAKHMRNLHEVMHKQDSGYGSPDKEVVNAASWRNQLFVSKSLAPLLCKAKEGLSEPEWAITVAGSPRVEGQAVQPGHAARIAAAGRTWIGRCLFLILIVWAFALYRGQCQSGKLSRRTHGKLFFRCQAM